MRPGAPKLVKWLVGTAAGLALVAWAAGSASAGVVSDDVRVGHHLTEGDVVRIFAHHIENPLPGTPAEVVILGDLVDGDLQIAPGRGGDIIEIFDSIAASDLRIRASAGDDAIDLRAAIPIVDNLFVQGSGTGTLVDGRSGAPVEGPPANPDRIFVFDASGDLVDDFDPCGLLVCSDGATRGDFAGGARAVGFHHDGSVPHLVDPDAVNSIVLHVTGRPLPGKGDLALVEGLQLGSCLVDAGLGGPIATRIFDPNGGFQPLDAPFASLIGPGGGFFLLPTTHLCFEFDGWRVKIHGGRLYIWRSGEEPPFDVDNPPFLPTVLSATVAPAGNGQSEGGDRDGSGGFPWAPVVGGGALVVVLSEGARRYVRSRRRDGPAGGASPSDWGFPYLADPPLGVWTTPDMMGETGSLAGSPGDPGGDLVQVSRLGMPLVNEVVIGLRDKDRFVLSGVWPGDVPTFVAPVPMDELIGILFPGEGPGDIPAGPRAFLGSVKDHFSVDLGKVFDAIESRSPDAWSNLPEPVDADPRVPRSWQTGLTVEGLWCAGLAGGSPLPSEGDGDPSGAGDEEDEVDALMRQFLQLLNSEDVDIGEGLRLIRRIQEARAQRARRTSDRAGVQSVTDYLDEVVCIA